MGADDTSGRLVDCRAAFEEPFFPLSLWERVRVRGFSSPVGTLTPALSRREREKAQPVSSIKFGVMEYSLQGGPMYALCCCVR